MNLTPTAHWFEWVDWANPILQDTGFRVKNGKYYILEIQAQELNGMNLILKNIKLIYSESNNNLNCYFANSVSKL